MWVYFYDKFAAFLCEHVCVYSEYCVNFVF